MAHLVLQDGTTFEGTSFGAPLRASTPPSTSSGSAQHDVFGSGEVVFNTGMVGYPESLTDPSYRGQILVFTYPLIGNYGVPSEELNEWGFSKYFESEQIHVRGVICSQVSEDFSHHAGTKSLPQWLQEHGIPALTGIDTRALTKKLREHGVMLGRISEGDSASTKNQPSPRLRPASQAPNPKEIEDPNLLNLVGEVSCREVITYEPTSPFVSAQGDTSIPTIVVFDCGIKRNILRSLLNRGVRVIRAPWNFDLSSADFRYDGVVISNGPGDPKQCTETIRQVQWALEKGIPTFGICLGIQLMALAIGGNTYKLKYGHRGANQPCGLVNPKHQPSPRLRPASQAPNPKQVPSTNDQNSTCIITSQNHGFAVEEKSLPPGWSVWFRNANDGTVEGIRHESGKFFAVQFHPEATPGPEDAAYLFDEFLSILRPVLV